MATTKKTEYRDDQTANNNFLQSILNNESEQARPAVNERNTAGKADTDKVLVNFKMNRATLERLRSYCQAKDMTLTAGIKRAIIKMLDNE